MLLNLRHCGKSSKKPREQSANGRYRVQGRFEHIPEHVGESPKAYQVDYCDFVQYASRSEGLLREHQATSSKRCQVEAGKCGRVTQDKRLVNQSVHYHRRCMPITFKLDVQ